VSGTEPSTNRAPGVHAAPRTDAGHRPELDVLRKRARTEYDALQFRAAIVDAESIVSADPDDVPMAQVIALSAIFAGDFGKARTAVQDSLGRHPNHVTFLYLGCKIALLDGELERARELAKRLLRHHGELPEANALAADCFMLSGQARTARTLLEKAVLLGSAAPDPFYRLACICLGDKDYAAGLRNFLYAIKSGRRDLDAYIGAGYCYLGLGDHRGAKEMCSEVFARGPLGLAGWELKFCVASATGDRDEALAVLTEIRKIDPGWQQPVQRA
jgi:tetratricopeptide (TPR) repeat protein